MTKQEVLGLLFGQPEHRFTVTDIIRMTGSGSGAVQRELARFVECGLVSVARAGNQKHYQANRASPIFSELHSIVMKTSGLAGPLRESLVSIAKQIELALVYGSIARREDRADSDIDLLIVADDLTLEKLFAKLGPLERKLGRKVNPTLYTSEEFRRRRRSGNAFLKNVLAGEHIVLLGSEDAVSTAR